MPACPSRPGPPSPAENAAIRLVWVIVSILFGAIVVGVIAYLLAWLIIPRPP